MLKTKAAFDVDLATAFCKGYMREAGAYLTDADRARVQFRLCEAVEARERSIRNGLKKL